jgi:hypothetical protein
MASAFEHILSPTPSSDLNANMTNKTVGGKEPGKPEQMEVGELSRLPKKRKTFVNFAGADGESSKKPKVVLPAAIAKNIIAATVASTTPTLKKAPSGTGTYCHQCHQNKPSYLRCTLLKGKKQKQCGKTYWYEPQRPSGIDLTRFGCVG